MLLYLKSAIFLIFYFTGCAMTNSLVQFEAVSNPSTGYSWDVSMEGDGSFELRRQVISSSSQRIAGAPVREKFTLRSVNSGTVTVHFLYRRPWENGGRHVEYIFTFRINEELQAELVDTQKTFFNGEGPDTLWLIVD